MLRTTKRTVRRARALRREMALPEVLLWEVLRTRPDGFKFRRQHPAGPYVLDFFSDSSRLAIEVDGVAHDMGNNPTRDLERDRWFTEAGIRVLRIPASEILNEIEPVLASILEACAAEQTPPPR